MALDVSGIAESESEVSTDDLEILADETSEEETPGEDSENDEKEDTEVKIDKPDLKSDEKTEEKTEDKEEEELPDGHYVRPKIADIKAKYPNFFKDFPQIKEAMFRENAYSEEFPTLEDAKEAKAKAETFDAIESDILQGNAGNFFTAISKLNSEVAERFTDNLLPHLYKANEGLYWRVVNPVLRSFVKQMHLDGKRSGNENMANAALFAANFAGIEDEDLDKPPKIEDNKISERERQLSERERRLEQEAYDRVFSTVSNEVIQEIDRVISELVKNDKGTTYEKKSFVRDIKEELNKTMGSDKKHNELMTSLWTKAKNSGFNKEWQDRIKSAYLSRAQAVLPAIRSRVRKQVFGETSASKSVDEKVVETRKTQQTKTEVKPDKRFKSDLELLQED